MTDETKDEKPAFAPTFMYHADEPAGRIFESQSEIDAAGDGWVDSPAAIGAEPAKGKKAKAGKDLA